MFFRILSDDEDSDDGMLEKRALTKRGQLQISGTGLVYDLNNYNAK